MKKKIVMFQLLFCVLFYGQSWEVGYKYEVKNSILNKFFEFPATLKLDKKGQKLYSVQFGIGEQVRENSSNTTFSLIDKSSYLYVLYSNEDALHIIGDEINGKKYLFSDVFLPIKYKITGEKKVINKVELTRAEAEFRGRKYIIWLDMSSSIQGGPWKFTNLPGIAYEIYDEDNLFRWSLNSIKKLNVDIKNPFNSTEFKKESLPYTEYPKLKYTSSVFFGNGTKSTSSYRKVEQNRDGLEKSFEWEN
ncbi:GLPGLI family protein [Riemerella anatipestifer]|uniref:GLPGLI family protein n=1 Tax=Riemerella anatipestifer TaxID=34085 RepID=UPI00129E0C4A|nr:GLPGLI family protein [Riemerella anatipestifer]MRM83115.1 GLPGLI family protein [Riemerella anatipestifer]